MIHGDTGGGGQFAPDRLTLSVFLDANHLKIFDIGMSRHWKGVRGLEPKEHLDTLAYDD